MERRKIKKTSAGPKEDNQTRPQRPSVGIESDECGGKNLHLEERGEDRVKRLQYRSGKRAFLFYRVGRGENGKDVFTQKKEHAPRRKKGKRGRKFRHVGSEELTNRDLEREPCPRYCNTAERKTKEL